MVKYRSWTMTKYFIFGEFLFPCAAETIMQVRLKYETQHHYEDTKQLSITVNTIVFLQVVSGFKVEEWKISNSIAK